MKTLKALLLIITMLGNFLFLQAQQTNNWYFGSAAGFPNTGLRIDFSSGSPVVSTCYPLMTEEGSSSISDDTGSPLFYTDGVSIWDASTNTTFGTGMLGGSSATQSAIVMPKPGATNQWLVFTSGPTATNGINYYTVSGTPGSFSISGATNLAPAGTVGEGLFVIGSTKAGSSFWVIARDKDATGVVRAWDVSNTGAVTTGAVTSTLSGAGFTNTTYSSKIGTIKSNTCQNQLAFTYLSTDVDLVDFNTATGQVVANTARRITVASGGGNSGSYGIEFSPNDDYLYITNLAGHNIYRHDIAANSTALLGSVTDEAGQLQLGPDGKIYMARMNGSSIPSYLGIIDSPDTGGSFTANGLLLSGVTCGGNAGFSYRGLPTFPKSLVVSDPIGTPGDGTYCVNTSIPLSFTFAGSINTATINWKATGGGESFSPGGTTSTDPSPSVTFSTTGSKTVIVTFDDACGRSYSDTMSFNILTPKVPAGSISCGGSTITLTATGAIPGDYPNYIWYDAASGGNVLGVGSPVTLNYGDGVNAPSSVWVEVGATASSTSGANKTIGLAPGGLSGAAESSPYGPVPFNVLADLLTLKSFVVKTWNATGNFDVEIKNGSNAIVFLKTYTISTANAAYTVNINVDLPQDNYTITLKNSSLSWWRGTWNGATNAGEASLPTFGGVGAYSLANFIYDYKNFSVTTTCSQKVQVNRSCTLPVKLISFEAERNNDDVLLSWITATEQNNERFEIERSIDGINFETIGSVSGKGNSQENVFYSYTDLEPYPGITYYRLVQYDFDGKKQYGPVKSVSGLNTVELTALPNPSSGSFTISVPSSLTGSIISVTDVLGRELFQRRMDAEKSQLEFGNDWPEGVYLLQWYSESKMKVIRLVKE